MAGAVGARGPASGGGVRRVAIRLAALVAGIAPVAAAPAATTGSAANGRRLCPGAGVQLRAHRAVTPRTLAERRLYTLGCPRSGFRWSALPPVTGARRFCMRGSSRCCWPCCRLPVLPHYYLMVLPPLAPLVTPGVLALRQSSLRAAACRRPRPRRDRVGGPAVLGMTTPA